MRLLVASSFACRLYSKSNGLTASASPIYCSDNISSSFSVGSVVSQCVCAIPLFAAFYHTEQLDFSNRTCRIPSATVFFILPRSIAPLIHTHAHIHTHTHSHTHRGLLQLTRCEPNCQVTRRKQKIEGEKYVT